MRISALAVAALGLAFTVAVLQAADVHITGLQAGRSVEVVGGATGAVGPAGDLDIALDASKNFNVYQVGTGTSCQVTYRIVEAGTAEDQECQRSEQDPNADPCRKCRRVGAVLLGAYSPGGMATVDAGGGSNMVWWVGGAALGVGGGTAIYLLAKDDEADAANTPGVTAASLVNKSFTGSGPKSADGCTGVANFFPTANIRVAFPTFADSGGFGYSLSHLSQVAGQPDTVFSGTGTWTRNADGTIALTFGGGVNGNFTSTATGIISTDGNRITNLVNSITRSSGCTGPVTYTVATLQ